MFDDCPACLLYSKHAGCFGDRHRVKPKASSSVGKERWRNKQSHCCVYSSCNWWNWSGDASQFGHAEFLFVRLAFTPHSQLSQIKALFKSRQLFFPCLHFSCLVSLSIFSPDLVRCSRIGAHEHRDEKMLHKVGGDWRIYHVRKATVEWRSGKSKRDYHSPSSCSLSGSCVGDFKSMLLSVTPGLQTQLDLIYVPNICLWWLKHMQEETCLYLTHAENKTTKTTFRCTYSQAPLYIFKKRL